MLKETEVDELDAADNPEVELLDHRVKTSVKRGRPVPGQTRSSATTEPARARATNAKGERMMNHSLQGKTKMVESLKNASRRNRRASL